MPRPQFDIPTDVIDGVNPTFFTLRPYTPGTVRQYLNGQFRPKVCVTEVDATTGEVRLDPPPRLETPPIHLVLYYLDTVFDFITVVVDEGPDEIPVTVLPLTPTVISVDVQCIP